MADEVVHFVCPVCGNHLRAPQEMAGRKANCRHCQTVVAVPGAPKESLDAVIIATPPPCTPHPSAPRPEGPRAPAPVMAKPQAASSVSPEERLPAPRAVFPEPVRKLAPEVVSLSPASPAAVPRLPQSPVPAPAAAAMAPPPVQVRAAPSNEPTSRTEAGAGGGDMGRILRWIREGVRLGLRFSVTLAAAAIVVWILTAVSAALFCVPWIFVTPPLVGGMVLLYVSASRDEPAPVGSVFLGFSDGRYWASMGVFWLSFLINVAASIPTMILVVLGLGAATAAIAAWGMIGMAFLSILIPLACAPVIYVQSRLIWAMPLVLDGEYPVIDAFSVSWWLTGRLLRGFGMFIMLSLLAALATAAAIVVSSLSAAVLAGSVGATAGEIAMQQRSLAVQSDDLEPRPNETPQQHKERVFRAFEGQQQMASGAVSGVVIAVLLTAGMWIVLSSLLAACLGMPVFVGYRDMAPTLRRGPLASPCGADFPRPPL